MVRVKGGIVTRRKHKKLVNMAKGYWMSRNNQIKKVKEALLHAGEYAFAGRKLRKRDFRSLWIMRINAAMKERGLKYGVFINQLKEKSIDLDRKILAKVAVDYPAVFDKIVKAVSE